MTDFDDFELTNAVPALSRPNVNSLEFPNTSIPEGNPLSSTQVEAAHSNTNSERAYGKAHSRGGGVRKFTEAGTGLSLAGPYGPHRLWLPEEWLDWSVIHSGDSSGE